MFTWKPLDNNETLEQARERQVKEALNEDIGTGDLTAQLTPNKIITAKLWLKEPAVLCGKQWFEDCFYALDSQMNFSWKYEEGDTLPTNTLVVELKGDSRAILSAERSALNFLQTLSATASKTKEFVNLLIQAGITNCAILDTRKTLPGFRLAQKYAVRIGHGHNQRLALWDGILIKENHIAAAGGIKAIWEKVQQITNIESYSLQIEVENQTQLQQAIEAGFRNILLDNFSLSQLTHSVDWVKHQTLTSEKITLEASGGISKDSLIQIAKTGVDRISMGHITKNIRAIDYSLRIPDFLV
jgi:nicotinate-nucleotide pyrophosphorylase (carboxylating)